MQYKNLLYSGCSVQYIYYVYYCLKHRAYVCIILAPCVRIMYICSFFIPAPFNLREFLQVPRTFFRSTHSMISLKYLYSRFQLLLLRNRIHFMSGNTSHSELLDVEWLRYICTFVGRKDEWIRNISVQVILFYVGCNHWIMKRTNHKTQYGRL